MGITSLFSSAKGDLNFPITPPSNNGATPGNLDNTAIGQTAPAPVTASTLGVTNAGTLTLNGATPVTVAAPGVTANSQVLITLKTVGGTVGAQPHVETITPGTGFTVEGTAADTSVYNYAIIN
jgi:hypothetical protein